jgi:hypothetical protein
MSLLAYTALHMKRRKLKDNKQEEIRHSFERAKNVVDML